MEHLAETDVKTALSEFYRCLRPNGTLNIIDIDGFLYNLYPQTELVDRVLKKVASERPFDLHIGRKLPKLIHDAQFVDVDWRVETLTFKGEKLEDEMVLLREKFSQGLPYFSQSLGSETIAKQFVQEYFECLGRKGAVLFYNKFIVQAKKPPLAISK